MLFFPVKSGKEIQMNIRKCFFLFIMFLLCALAAANELTWYPVNPSFGGNPGNATWLMSAAQEQNAFKESASSQYKAKTAVEQFSENLNRLILNKLSNKIVDAIYEGGELQTGDFEMGNYLIHVNEGELSVTVVIDDMITGGQTIIEVPYDK